MERMSLLGFGVCVLGADPGGLSFPVGGIDREAMPAALRRRASEATQLAFSAAARACRHAGRSPAELPTVFASVGGEMQVTDSLCIELAKPDGLISPTAFHNSVHNTAAGYWTIVHACREPASALAAGEGTFALALLESWCQLACRGGELLLVCYDERWPDYLAPPLGGAAVASALVLAAGEVAGRLASLGRPTRGSPDEPSGAWGDLVRIAPAAWVLTLLQELMSCRGSGTAGLSPDGWRIPWTTP